MYIYESGEGLAGRAGLEPWPGSSCGLVVPGLGYS